MELDEEKVLRLREGMSKLKEEYIRRRDSGTLGRKTVKPVIEPIYDEVYYEGVKWLDKL